MNLAHILQLSPFSCEVFNCSTLFFYYHVYISDQFRIKARKIFGKTHPAKYEEILLPEENIVQTLARDYRF